MASLLKILRIIPFRSQCLSTIRNSSTHTNMKMPQTSLANLINPWIIRRQNEFKLPVSTNNQINLPSGMFYIPKIDIIKEDIMEAPNNANSDNTIQAARLIVIRRKKMRKHKLKKLRKKMKFEWAKVRQKRELKKEKEFQAGLIQRCKKAEAFSAEEYVRDRLEKYKEAILPLPVKEKNWRQLMIKEKQQSLPKK